MRVAVVGATGAVGSTMLEVLAQRSFPADEVVPFASERSAGRTLPGAAPSSPASRSRRGDPGLRHRACSRPARRERRVGAALRRGGRGRGRQLVAVAHGRGRAARRLRGQPRCAGRPQRHRRQPELHDDADGRGARADPAPRGHRAGRDVELSGGLRHRPEGRRRAGRAGAGGRAREELPQPAVYPHQIAFNVLPQVESFKDGDDYTTEERKCMRETRKILGRDDVGVSATCVRVPVFTGHSVSANVQTREPLSPEECRDLLACAPGPDRDRRPGNALTRPRSTRPAATTCWSAASAATPRTSAASTSGSSATTCARAPRRTPSRWRSCCTCADCCGRRRRRSGALGSGARVALNDSNKGWMGRALGPPSRLSVVQRHQVGPVGADPAWTHPFIAVVARSRRRPALPLPPPPRRCAARRLLGRRPGVGRLP